MGRPPICISFVASLVGKGPGIDYVRDEVRDKGCKVGTLRDLYNKIADDLA